MSIRWMYKQTVAHLYNKMLSSNKNELTTDTVNDADES